MADSIPNAHVLYVRAVEKSLTEPDHQLKKIITEVANKGGMIYRHKGVVEEGIVVRLKKKGYHVHDFGATGMTTLSWSDARPNIFQRFVKFLFSNDTMLP